MREEMMMRGRNPAAVWFFGAIGNAPLGIFPPLGDPPGSSVALGEENTPTPVTPVVPDSVTRGRCVDTAVMGHALAAYPPLPRAREESPQTPNLSLPLEKRQPPRRR